MPVKTVLVTGCSSGIGKAVAIRLASEGHVVWATARRPESLADCVSAGCRPLTLDVDDEVSRVAAVRAVESEHDAVDVLVNNAGFSVSGALETLPLERVRAQLETNVLAPLRLAQLVAPAMRARGAGRIVNISSMGGTLTFPGGGAYHASKYALEALSDALRFELRGFGIDVVVIQPGLIRTRFGETAASGVQTSEDPVYGAFNAAVATATREVYEQGPLAPLGGDASAVAAVVARAVAARRPAARYRVTASAHLLMTLRRSLPDAGWDAFLRSSFPSPGAPA